MLGSKIDKTSETMAANSLRANLKAVGGVTGAYAALIEFVSRLWLVNFPTYILTAVPEVVTVITHYWLGHAAARGLILCCVLLCPHRHLHGGVVWALRSVLPAAVRRGRARLPIGARPLRQGL